MFLSLDLQALTAKLLRFDAARKVFERPSAVDQAQVNTVADVATGVLFLVDGKGLGSTHNYTCPTAYLASQTSGSVLPCKYLIVRFKPARGLEPRTC